ncbi:MAG: hypothetical protein EZS28_008860 [Streblomastix strix]|uniref:RRM domain-containing protein n=1 Tax=Streblomastix strix TaxID=222440 RepID=A0A5J4WMZ9_9EUKA|nr:MAG: hypothetical protein EZS28_008860 [Streblomastix strix]
MTECKNGRFVGFEPTLPWKIPIQFSFDQIFHKQSSSSQQQLISLPQIGLRNFGPRDSNLFVNYLPNNVTDVDLFNLFSPFGQVLSANIFLDQETGISKGFGFVSYENPISASNAVLIMDGYELVQKRPRRMVTQQKKQQQQQQQQKGSQAFDQIWKPGQDSLNEEEIVVKRLKVMIRK